MGLCAVKSLLLQFRIRLESKKQNNNNDEEMELKVKKLTALEIDPPNLIKQWRIQGGAKMGANERHFSLFSLLFKFIVAHTPVKSAAFHKITVGIMNENSLH